MGWASGDEEKRDKCKTELALSRVPLYRLSQNVNSIKHEEKGVRLRALVKAVYEALDQIEFELRR